MIWKLLLGTIGSRAPFHSQRQKRTQTNSPEKRVARTIAELQGKVTPPYSKSYVLVSRKNNRMKNVFTQMIGKITSAHATSVKDAPTQSIARSFLQRTDNEDFPKD